MTPWVPSRARLPGDPCLGGNQPQGSCTAGRANHYLRQLAESTYNSPKSTPALKLGLRLPLSFNISQQLTNTFC